MLVQQSCPPGRSRVILKAASWVRSARRHAGLTEMEHGTCDAQRRTMGRKRLISGACTLAIGLVLAGTGAAQAEQVSFWTGVSPQPSWDCNDTSGFYAPAIGWVYAQGCLSVNYPYLQGLYRLSFSQAHSNVSIEVSDYSSDAGYTTGTERTCTSSVVSGVTYTCFAHTEDVSGGADYYGAADQLVVDGTAVSLSDTSEFYKYGPDQLLSPGVGYP